MEVRVLGRFTSSSPQQLLKALSPIEVKPSGIVTEVSAVQPENTPVFRLVIVVGRVIDAKLPQSLKAQFPIPVNPRWNSIDVRPSQL